MCIFLVINFVGKIIAKIQQCYRWIKTSQKFKITAKTVAGQSSDLMPRSVQNVFCHHSIISTAKNITETIRVRIYEVSRLEVGNENGPKLFSMKTSTINHGFLV